MIIKTSEDFEKFEHLTMDRCAKGDDISTIFGAFTNATFVFHMSEIRPYEPNKMKLPTGLVQSIGEISYGR
jgi:hypothetical protein